MRLLVDTCVAIQVVEKLRASGHDVIYVGDRPSDPGDAEILREASENNRVLITRDKDFGMLAIVNRSAHRGIVLLRRLPLREQATACETALNKHAEDLSAGSIVTIQPGKIRVRKPRKL